jgi:polysaccharide export outer membrane protein
VPELAGSFVVDTAGNIEFPLIGTVQARGHTAAGLRQVMATRLDRFVVRPNVNVVIEEAAERTITVDGSVQQPGIIPVRGSTTLVRAVASARGASEDANLKRVVVFRTINGQRMAAAFDLNAIRRGEAEDPVIHPNDVVIVDGSRARQTFRDALSVVPLLGIFRPF